MPDFARLRHRAQLGLYSAFGASVFPMLAAQVLVKQRRRSSIPPPPSDALPLTDPRGTGALSTLRAFMPDLAVYMGELDPARTRFAYAYPQAFGRTVVEVEPGVRLACRVALHGEPHRHPTLILVPGMFATASQNVVVELAKKAHAHWGYNVVVADMRDFGETARVCAVPTAMGSREGHDVVALGRWARDFFGTPQVSVLGFSFGGAVALSAGLAGEGVIDRVVAFCPPLDVAGLVTHFSQPVAGVRSFSLFQLFYQWMLLRSARLRGHDQVEHFHDYVTKVVAGHYGMELEALYEAVDLRARMPSLRVQTLVIHADDDPVLPYQHTLELARAALRHDNRHLRVEISAGGGHYGHWTVMPDWTERTVREFLA